MLVSILHRATGGGMATVGALLLVWWLAAIAAGAEAYADFVDVFTTDTGELNILGWIIGVGLTLSFFQHMMTASAISFMDAGAVSSCGATGCPRSPTMASWRAADRRVLALCGVELMGKGTSIGRVRGLGSAKEGTHHWWRQRLTAGSNLLLMLWFFISIARLTGYDHATVMPGCVVLGRQCR